MTVHLYLRGPDLTRVAEIDDYRELTLTRKHAGIGTWSLRLHTRSPWASSFAPGYGVIIVRNSEILASGPLSSMRREMSDEDDAVTISGYEDSVWLARRWAEPSPRPYVRKYDEAEGLTESVLKHYVNNNLGPGAATARQLRGLTIARDQFRGPLIQQRARFEPLHELLAQTALIGGDMHFYMRQIEHESLIAFDVRPAINRSASVRFALELGNLAAFDYEQTAPEANFVLVGAGDADAAWGFLDGGRDDSIAEWGRIEGPIRDSGGTIDIAEMTNTLDETLAKEGQKLSIAVHAVETERLRHGREWGLSDIVSVEIDGAVFSDIVREETFTWAAESPERLSAVIGTPEASHPAVPRLFAAQRKVAARTAFLERRK